MLQHSYLVTQEDFWGMIFNILETENEYFFTKGLSAFSLSLGEIMERTGVGAVQCPGLGRKPQTSVLPGDVVAEASQC